MSTGLPDRTTRLVADIGGTNARFALIEAPGAAPSHIRVLACADFAGPEAAVHAYLAAEGVSTPRAAASRISLGPSSSGKPWPRLIAPCLFASADMTAKIVTGRPAKVGLKDR